MYALCVIVCRLFACEHFRWCCPGKMWQRPESYIAPNSRLAKNADNERVWSYFTKQGMSEYCSATLYVRVLCCTRWPTHTQCTLAMACESTRCISPRLIPTCGNNDRWSFLLESVQPPHPMTYYCTPARILFDRFANSS